MTDMAGTISPLHAKVEAPALRLLGDMQVSSDVLPPVLPQPGRVASLLALLALEPGRVVSAERLMDQLWEDTPPQSGVAALYVYVSRLRRQLAPLGVSVTTRAPGYVLEVAPDVVDIVLFSNVVAAAESALEERDLEEAEFCLRHARALWRGDPFQGTSACSDLLLEAQRLQRLRDRMSELDARLLLATGQARAAADLARTLTERDPLNEAHWALRMEAERDCGNIAVALALFEEFREILADSLGIDPGARLRHLHTDLLQDDLRTDLNVTSASDTSPPAGHAGIGRTTHLDEIRSAISSAPDGHGRLLILEGQPGVGKTYLAEQAARIAEDVGLVTAWARTVEGTGAPPLWPWQRILAALPGASDPTGAGEVAHLRSQIEPSDDADEARFRLSEALVARVLTQSSQRPTLLVFDDVQWADDPTLHAIGVLGSALRSSACVVILTVRQPVAHRPALASTLAGLQRETTTRRLPVSEFTLAEIAEELARTSELRADDLTAVAERLRERTGGNAFFLTELMKAADGVTLPASIADLIHERLAPLSPSLRDLVDTAAVAGLHIDVPLLAAALGVGLPEIMSGADELCAAGLWRQEPDGFMFAHSLARDSVLSAVSRAGMSRAHQLLADALERRYSADLEPVLEAVAYHRHRAAAGMSDEKAFLACTTAADRATRSLAFDQAATFRERALGCIPTDELEPRRRAETLFALTAERRAGGDVVGAASALRQAIRAAQQLQNRAFTAQVLALLGEATLWNWRQYGEVDADAISLLEDLLSDPSLPDAERSDLSVALAMELYYADEPDRSRAKVLTDEAVVRAAQMGDPARRSRAYSAAVFSVWRPDSETARLSILDEWLAPSSTSGAIPGEIVARLHRASVHLVLGEIDAWSEDIERAGELLTRAGRAEFSAQHAAQMAGAALQAGRLGDATELMDRADAIMRRTSMWGGAWVTWMQRLTLARIEGRVADIADDLLAAASPDGQRALRWGAVLALAEAGRIDEARAMQGRWNLRTMPKSSTWTTDFDVAQAAEVAVHLGTPLLTDAYDNVSRSSSPLLMAGTGVAVLGSRDELLARIATRLGRHSAAAEHRERARRVTEKVRAALGVEPAWPLRSE